MVDRVCVASEQSGVGNFEGSEEYTHTVRSKFILSFAIFAINSQKRQANESKSFFQRLNEYIEAQEPVTTRVQMGIDFACTFQTAMLESLISNPGNEPALLRSLKQMYELLVKQESGCLFGYDKLAFIIDANLNQLSLRLQTLVERCEMP